VLQKAEKMPSTSRYFDVQLKLSDSKKNVQGEVRQRKQKSSVHSSFEQWLHKGIGQTVGSAVQFVVIRPEIVPAALEVAQSKHDNE